MGIMDQKHSLVLWFKSFMKFLPLVSYLCNCEPLQTVTIQVVENFNNREYSANAIEFAMTNTSLVFNSATIIVKSSLFGIRYFMRNWFLTTALVFISTFSSMIFLSFVAFFVVLKKSIRVFLFKLTPSGKSSKSKTNKRFDKKLDIDLSDEQTDE